MPGATATYSGRIGVSPHVVVEPNLSLNWVRLPFGNFDARSNAGHGSIPPDGASIVAKTYRYVVGGAALRIGSLTFRYVGGWIAPRVERNAPVAQAEMPHLELPAPMIPGEFVHEDQRCAGAGLLIVKANFVVGHGKWHG